jgi:DNA polymerase bacteriophage-type
MAQKTLSIDIETYSETDLISCGVYRYVSDPNFTVLMVAYKYQDEPVKIIDYVAGDNTFNPVELEFLNYLDDPEIKKIAWNAQFERLCLNRFYKKTIPISQWECTMARAAAFGLPLSLDATSTALSTALKDSRGKALIKYFSVPQKPTKINGMRTRNLPEHDPKKWAEFLEYCKADVKAESDIRLALDLMDANFTKAETALYILDQKINDTGVKVDVELIQGAINISNDHTEKLTAEAVKLTGLLNPNSAAQLKKWFSEALDTEIETLRKSDLPELKKLTDCPEINRVIEIRKELAKTSVKKYEAMMDTKGDDQRIRGLLQFNGANRTGRWAGRLVQVQNLPQNHIDDLTFARGIIKGGDCETMAVFYDNIPSVLSQCIRTAFIAEPGHRFIVSDFSAIEARVIAWLAGEKWRLDVFATHGKIYEASAAQMFGVPIDQITKGSPLRQKGKVAELALGYQGGPNALIKMGALNMGIEEKDLREIVDLWRGSNKKIVKLWGDVEKAAILALENPKESFYSHGLQFTTVYFENDIVLKIILPSGRPLVYFDARIKQGKFGNVISYAGMDQTTKKWTRQETYGGKLIENIVQAIARDCLAWALLRINKAGYKIVMHVHDEIIVESPYGFGSLDEVNSIMSQPIPWAPGLILKGEGFETEFYKKD